MVISGELSETYIPVPEGWYTTAMARSVLLADDNEDIRELLELKLGSTFDLTTVRDGEEAWDVLTSRAGDPPDVVVLDVMMPGLDGYRLLNRIEADERFDDVDVIMLTARGGENDVVRALESGATDYMTKPFSAKELEARIDRLPG